MTKSQAIRKHPLYRDYVEKRHWRLVRYIRRDLAAMGIEATRQNLYDAAKWDTGRGRGRPPKPRGGVTCPYCAHELVIEVAR